MTASRTRPGMVRFRIVLLSVLPMVLEYLRERSKLKARAASE